MAKLAAIDAKHHSDKKIAKGAQVAFAARQHAMNLRVTELANAATSFPVFITRYAQTGSWAISAITSFTPGVNLFVENAEWHGLYQPTAMQCHPLYLMQSKHDARGYAVGVFEEHLVAKDKPGEPLFDEQGKLTIQINQRVKILEADIKHDIQTHQFILKLEQLGLLKALDIQVHYLDGNHSTLRGLHTVNEDALQELKPQQLAELNQSHYLAPLYALLHSILQLNALIKRNNARSDLNKIEQIKLQLNKGVAIDGASY